MCSQPVREIEIQTRFLRFGARLWGPPEGEPVLSLHGWLDNAASFDFLAPLLPGKRIVAVDMAGHGRSQHRPDGVHYHFIDFVPDILAVADSLGWNRFSMVSHSLGAGVSAVLAGTVPERVERLVLIEGLGPWSGTAESTPGRLAEASHQLLHKKRRRAPGYPSLEQAAEARRKVGDLSREAALTLAGRGTKKLNDQWIWRSDPRLTYRSPIYLTEEQVCAFLSRIEAPTLLIRGETGLDAPQQRWEARARVVPDIECLTLPGGHHLHMESPQPVAEAINRFFGRHPRQSA
ncbi:MAG: alpha/beta fold hydrolase [Gammaproteobacteria bacterium]